MRNIKICNIPHTPSSFEWYSMDMVGEVCLPSNAYYTLTPDYTLYSGAHVCWSEHSDLSFVYGFMSLDYGLGTMTATTFSHIMNEPNSHVSLQLPNKSVS